MEPVPIRPLLPVPLPTAPQAEFAAFAVNNAITGHSAPERPNHEPPSHQYRTHHACTRHVSIPAILHPGAALPPNGPCNQDLGRPPTRHRAHCHQQPDRYLAFRHRDRAPREWRQSPPSFDPQPADSRASRSSMTLITPPRPSSHSKRPHDSPHNATSDVRAATPTSTSSSPGTKNPYPCSNCGGDHRAQECDNPNCFICQTVFPNPAARQAHYLSIHKRDTKRARFGQDPPRGHFTPPTSPFLSRSAQDMNNPSPYDSGYDSTYSSASGPGHPPSSRENSDMDEQVDRYLHDQRVATLIVEGMPPTNPPPTTPAAQARLHAAAQHYHRLATYHQLLSSLPRTTPPNPQAQPTPWSNPPYENHIDSSRHAPSGYTISGIHTYVRPQRSPDSPSEPAPSDSED
jgi:hypothetical protein